MDNPAALRAFRSLAAAAAIDGKVSQPEMQLLVRKAKELRLDPSQAQEILRDAREGRLPLALPAEPREFMERLNDIIEVVCADGRLETQERTLLLRFASRVNLSEADLMARVRPQLQAAQQRLSAGGSRNNAPPPPPTRPAPPPVEVHEIRNEPRRPEPPRPPRPEPPRPEPPKGGGPAEPLTSYGDMSAPPQIAGNAAALTFTPGPVKLGGMDAMSMLSSDVSPVMLQLLRSQLEHGDLDEVIQYAKRYLNLKDDDEARRLIEKVLRENPDIKLGAQKNRR
jgi:uncharacterized tellurite resistance protein B-like protein